MNIQNTRSDETGVEFVSTTPVQIRLSTDELATIFSAMDSGQQASFLWFVTEAFGYMKGDMQLCHIGQELRRRKSESDSVDPIEWLKKLVAFTEPG